MSPGHSRIHEKECKLVVYFLCKNHPAQPLRSYFRDYPVVVETAIQVPGGLVPRIRSPMTSYLSGLGTIKSIINGLGGSTSSTTASQAWYCINCTSCTITN